MSILTTYAPQIEAIVAAITTNAAASKVASDANKERRDTLAETLRDYARVTHADGVDAGEASTALRAMMLAADVKTGTVKGYGASFKGYRHLLSEGADISEVNVKKAQEAVASEEVKALNAAKARLREAMGDFELADYVALAETAEAIKAAKETAEQQRKVA